MLFYDHYDHLHKLLMIISTMFTVIDTVSLHGTTSSTTFGKQNILVCLQL